MAAKLFAHLRGQWIGVIALLLVLTGGTAYALEGSNTVFSDDIVNGEVRNGDLGANAVGTGKIIDGHVKRADIGGGAVDSSKIADGQVRSSDVLNDNLTGVDVAPNSLKGADIDEATLDVGDAARAYARVFPFLCSGTPETCPVDESKGISGVTRDQTGAYCVTAPGIDSNVTPAAVTVDSGNSSNDLGNPVGNASAMSRESFGCGASGQGFAVETARQPLRAVNGGSGINNVLVSGLAEPANNVAFTIVIP